MWDGEEMFELTVEDLKASWSEGADANVAVVFALQENADDAEDVQAALTDLVLERWVDGVVMAAAEQQREAQHHADPLVAWQAQTGGETSSAELSKLRLELAERKFRVLENHARKRGKLKWEAREQRTATWCLDGTFRQPREPREPPEPREPFRKPPADREKDDATASAWATRQRKTGLTGVQEGGHPDQSVLPSLL